MGERANAGADVIRLAWPDVGRREADAVAEVLETGRLTMGPKVEELEGALARACDTPYAVAVSSGTAALHLALLALGLGPEDEVIVPAFTFPATANVVAIAGAAPVLADVDRETMTLDAEHVAARLTPRTRAVIGVHLFGRPLDWRRLEQAVPSHVKLIEDAAGALGARYRDRPCGGLGVVGCVSFHPRKIVTTGEGGAVLTGDPELAERIRALRQHGLAADGSLQRPGLNYRLSELHAAVGIPQLERLGELLRAREQLAAAYSERLSGVVEIPSAAEGDRHGWQAYVVRLEARDRAAAALEAAGIETGIGTYAVQRLGPYLGQGTFPGAESCFAEALALPFHTRLGVADLDRVSETLRRALRAND